MTFSGFTDTSISFLKELALNNNKEWFEQNRQTYEKHLLQPLKQLTFDLGIIINSIDEHIDTTPQINRTISKIYRDTRFSKDKSPLRTDAWLSFKRPVKVWGNVPEFYFYFTTKEYQYGMGYYAASSENMEKFRDYMTSYPDRFKGIIDRYNSHRGFELIGEEYKKHIPNQHPEEFQEWFQKKNLCVRCIKKIDETFFSVRLEKEIESAFSFHADFYRFLIESIRF
jgi:uncharacterized protein (TIGR02453 family)